MLSFRFAALRRVLGKRSFRPVGSGQAMLPGEEPRPDRREERVDDAFLGNIIDHLPVGLFVQRADDGRFLVWNRESEELFCLPSAEVIGKTEHELFLRERGEGSGKGDRDVFATGDASDIPEERVSTATRGSRTVRTRKMPVRTGGGEPLYLLGVVEDITEIKEREQALKESEERYRKAVEHSNDAIAITRDEALFYMNRKYTQMFGYSDPEELKGCLFEKTVHPSDLEKVRKFAALRLKGEQVPELYEFRGLRKNGEDLYVEVSITTIEIAGRSYILEYFRDITGRKQEERLQRKRAHELADMVRELQLFKQFTVDRELRMIELKKMINDLRHRLNEAPLFNLDELEPGNRDGQYTAKGAKDYEGRPADVVGNGRN